MNAIANKRITVLLIVLILTVGVVGFKFVFGNNQETATKSVGTTYVANAPRATETNDDVIVFGGYKEYIVNSENRNIEFTNDAENNCTMVYRVIDVASGDIVIQSEAINPGERCFADIYYYYNQIGEYQVQIQSLPFNENGDLLNGLNYNVNVKVI